MVDPVAVLRRTYEALAPAGLLLMVDVAADSDVAGDNGAPTAPWVYAASALRCMTVSLAEGGAGLGTA